MRSRLALAALLTFGMLFTFTGGWTLAQSTGGAGGAAGSQYGGEGPTGGGGPAFDDGDGFDDGVGGGGGDGGAAFDDGGGGGDGGAAFDDGGGGGFDSGRQEAADDGVGLADTGFIAIPLLLIGVGFFGAGAVVIWKIRKS